MPAVAHPLLWMHLHRDCWRAADWALHDCFLHDAINANVSWMNRKVGQASPRRVRWDRVRPDPCRDPANTCDSRSCFLAYSPHSCLPPPSPPARKRELRACLQATMHLASHAYGSIFGNLEHWEDSMSMLTLDASSGFNATPSCGS